MGTPEPPIAAWERQGAERAIAELVRAGPAPRRYYAKEFLDFRRNRPTPYMEGLRFSPGGETADADRRVLSDEELERAVSEGEGGAS